MILNNKFYILFFSLIILSFVILPVNTQAFDCCNCCEGIADQSYDECHDGSTCVDVYCDGCVAAADEAEEEAIDAEIEAVSSTSTEDSAEYIEPGDIIYDLEAPFSNESYVGGLTEYVIMLHAAATRVGIILAVIVMFYYAFRYATSAGMQEVATQSKEGMVYAVIALLIFLLPIGGWINTQLTDLKALRILKITLPTSSSTTPCEWKTDDSDNDSNLTKSADSYCDGEKPEDQVYSAATMGGSSLTTTVKYNCYCDLRSSIVELARQYVSNPVLYWTCCWGWAHDIYVLANAGPKTTTYETGTAPTEDVLPGDWLYIYNGNSATENGQHSVIFLNWTDKSNLIGQCAGASPYKPSISECNFNDTPIASILTPYASEYTGVSPSEKVTSGSHPGVCGGMTASSLTVGKDL